MEGVITHLVPGSFTGQQRPVVEVLSNDMPAHAAASRSPSTKRPPTANACTFLIKHHQNAMLVHWLMRTIVVQRSVAFAIIIVILCICLLL